MTSVPTFAQWPYDCIEEDELEQDTRSQPSNSEGLFLLALEQISSIFSGKESQENQ